jgi:hypothetical protein
MKEEQADMSITQVDKEFLHQQELRQVQPEQQPLLQEWEEIMAGYRMKCTVALPVQEQQQPV